MSATRSGSQDNLHVKDQLSITKSVSLSDFEEKGASVILKEDQINNIFQEFPYVFASVGDLTLHDVEDLLNNYKQLVFKYTCLAKGLGVRPSPPGSSPPQAEAPKAVETVAEPQSSTVIEKDVEKSREHEESNKISHSGTETADSSQSKQDTAPAFHGEERDEVPESADSDKTGL